MLNLSKLATVLALCCAAAPVASAQKGFFISYRSSGGDDVVDNRLAIMPTGRTVATASQAGQLATSQSRVAFETLDQLESLFNLALVEDQEYEPVGAPIVYDLQICQNGVLQQILTTHPQGATATLVELLDHLQQYTMMLDRLNGAPRGARNMGKRALEVSLPSPVAGQGAQGLTLYEDDMLRFWREDEMGTRQLLDQVQLGKKAAGNLQQVFGALNPKDHGTLAGGSSAGILPRLSGPVRSHAAQSVMGASAGSQGLVKISIYDDNDRVRILRPDDPAGALSAFVKSIL